MIKLKQLYAHLSFLLEITLPIVNSDCAKNRDCRNYLSSTFS